MFLAPIDFFDFFCVVLQFFVHLLKLANDARMTRSSCCDGGHAVEKVAGAAAHLQVHRSR